MPRREILTHPDERLRRPTDPVTDFGADLQSLVDDLLDTRAAHEAFGLSSPQIGDHRSVLVIGPPGFEGRSVYVNPVITARSLWGFVEESCLSVPGIVGSVVRATRVSVTAQDRHGEPVEEELRDMAAVSLQHEIDHLHGKLFFDRFSPFGRMRTRMRLRRSAARRDAPALQPAEG
jgi:peptide deformylase